jgi:hypothetical protein
MDVVREGQLADAGRDLRGTKARPDRHHGCGVDPGPAEDREQVRGQARRHERIGREGRSHDDERPSGRRQHRARWLDGSIRPRIGIGAPARQREGMQRRGDERQHGGIDQIGAAPARNLDQQVGDRPAHRGGEAAGERDRRDQRSAAAPKMRPSVAKAAS